jgi:hypothetical protein
MREEEYREALKKRGREVIPSIARRLEELTDADTRRRVFEGIELPPVGSPPESYPPVTARLVGSLLTLGPETARGVLAGNHHGIPPQAFDRHVGWLEEAGDLDEFLRRMHAEAVRELERHALSGKIWFEQVITPEVVEMVRENQEMLSAVRKGDYLYSTKIPYAPADWLAETDSARKRYYACHCPLARASILTGRPGIPSDWCYCSGGFHKLKFDVIFDRPTEVEVLETVLAGDDRCRFRVRIPPA